LTHQQNPHSGGVSANEQVRGASSRLIGARELFESSDNVVDHRMCCAQRIGELARIRIGDARVADMLTTADARLSTVALAKYLPE
jgi:hypothetical protein